MKKIQKQMRMILNSLIEAKKENKKLLSVLIDPDKINHESQLDRLIESGKGLDYFMVGGSLLVSDHLNEIIQIIKQKTDIPVILFPGSNLHINHDADAILFLSLISGRNPELLIGQHVAAAPILKKSKLEILSTGYILIGEAAKTTVAYMSQTMPIPRSKPDIAVCTAMAGEMLGMKLIYMDAGSGAELVVPATMISEVRKSIDVPLIVGGGVRSQEKVEDAFRAGADMLVLGTAIEENIDFLQSALEIRNNGSL